MTAAEIFAEFTSSLSLARVPEAVVANAKLRVLDTVGIALASSAADFAPSVLRTACEWARSPKVSTVIGTRSRVPAPAAALANGALAHGLDFDDTHADSITHASACVVPPALALAEALSLPGREVLLAALAGWESITRLGAAAPNAFHARGFHATAVCGTFAAALVASRCLGLSTERTVHALGVAGSMAAGLFEYLADGSWVKRLHPGWAAHAGIMAATLARNGFTGPKTILEGRFGFFRTHLGDGEYDLGRLTKGLGEEWETLEISFKPYPCCHYNHAFIDATLRLARAHTIRPEDVEQIECRIAEGQIPIVCEPVAAKRQPRTPYDAQFSLPYAVSVALLDGRVGLESFGAARIGDPRVLALAERVKYVVDPTSEFPRVFPGWVIVRLRDGRALEAREPLNRGCPANPMSSDEIRAKFGDNAGRVLAKDDANRLADMLGSLETLPEVVSVMALCRRVRAQRKGVASSPRSPWPSVHRVASAEGRAHIRRAAARRAS